MVFSSTIFLFVFLPLTLCVYYMLSKLPIGFQNTWLLLASLFFYFWGEPKYIFVMLISILINYSFGIFIHLVQNKKTLVRRLVVSLAILCNLALLFYYKYFNFAVETVNSVFALSVPLRDILLPIGISFYTFQGLSYVIDLYWGNTQVQKNPLRIALYISLFPQLIAGPIVRYKDVARQIAARHISLDGLYCGIQRFIIGLAKKVIVANHVALVVDNIFALPYNEMTAGTAWLGIVCYALQIYFDFSGYSDMAIGLGRMLGFDFLENFNYPYISKSIREFWRRWHISLSSFFRDYLYIPLGGNRRGNVYLNSLIVFFATGLWHGASWNFVVWGLWHGLFIILERLTAKFTDRFTGPVFALLRRAYTLLVVLIGWVFFRAENLAYAFGYLRIMFGLQQPDSARVGFATGYYLDSFIWIILVLGILACLPWTTILQKLAARLRPKGVSPLLRRAVPGLRLVVLSCVFLVTTVFVLNSGYNPFIYFRF